MKIVLSIRSVLCLPAPRWQWSTDMTSSVEGIIDEDVDQSIRNLTKIGSKGMNETDKLVLEIMTSK